MHAAMLLCPQISIDEMNAGTSSHRPQANISECQRETALAASRKKIHYFRLQVLTRCLQGLSQRARISIY